jgi:hypothetical protein
MIPRYFSQHPEDVARRHRAYMEAIKPMQEELVRLHGMFPPEYVWFIPAGGAPENHSRPWEETLPPEIKQFVEHVRSHIARTALEYGFEAANVR